MPIVKTYPPRGPLQQYRLATSQTFHCFRCRGSKTSKLVTLYGQRWDRMLCNGCYGRLLSIHTIKAGTAPDDERADQLAQLLLHEVGEDSARQAAQAAAISHHRDALLSPLSLRFIGTAQVVADRLADVAQLDWSVATLGLCKAFEVEVVQRVIEPLKRELESIDLSGELADPDLARVAKYCAGRTDKPPELGTIAHFVRTAVKSQSRAATSVLIGGFRKLAAKQKDGSWLVREDGLSAAAGLLVTKFRNPSVHTSELSRNEFAQCRDLVIGQRGALWSLVHSTTR